MRKKEIKGKNGAFKAHMEFETSDESMLKMIKDMRRSLETLEEYELVELNPKSGKYRLTDKSDEAIKDFLDFMDVEACVEEFYYEKGLEITDGELLKIASKVIAMHVLDKFGVDQFKKKDDSGEMRLVECLSLFINITSRIE